MTALAGLVVVIVAVGAIVRRAEVRLTLLLAALALGVAAGRPEVIVRKFLGMMTNEQFVVPLCTCLGFAYVLRHTDCDRHLVHLLIRPVRHVRPLLIPGVVLVAAAVNVPVVSQTSTAVVVGSVLVPLLRAARVSPVTTGAALLLGSSIGGELLNPGAPELRTVATATGARSADCVSRIFPLLLVHLAVAVPLFWWLSLRAEARYEREQGEGPGEEEAKEKAKEVEEFRLNPVKALVPLVPLALLFLTALPEPLRAFTVPRGWLVGAKEPDASFDSRLIGAAMLVGVVCAAAAGWRRAGGTAGAFFEGAGYAYANIVSLIVVAVCFGEGVKETGLAGVLGRGMAAVPGLLLPSAAGLPLGFAWVCGSGMASTQSLYGFFVDPARAAGVDPLRVGAVVSLSAAAGRTASPVAAVVLMCASLTGTEPLALVRRVALPLLAGVAAVVAAGALLGG